MRYEPVSSDVDILVKQIIEGHFPELAGAKILCIFDLKKKMSKGKLVLAQIKKINELEKYLTLDDAGDMEGYDYFVFINKVVWNLAGEEDRVRIIRHEFRHTNVDNDSDKPYKLRDHTVSDFYEEIRLNRERPKWAEDLAIRAISAYSESGESEEEVKE
jgi:hypothetical protein